MQKQARITLYALLALAAVIATGVAFLAQWRWPTVAHAAQGATTQCVFVNHVRQGPGHPYRQEPWEKCRYEIDPRVAG